MRRAGGPRRRARRTATQWRKLVERFERSGQSRGNFCAANGLALSTFDLWRRKLGEAPAPLDEEHREELFVELASPAQPPGSATTITTGAWEVELELGAGVVLRLRRAGRC